MRKVNRWLTSRAGRRTLGGIVFFLPLVAVLGQSAGWWNLGHLLTGTVGPSDEQQVPLARVSVGSLGNEGNLDSFAPALSGDGQFVAFLSAADNLVPDDTNLQQDVFIYDRANEQIRRITMGFDGSEANGRSQRLSFSRDGQWVAFESDAANLVENDTNGVTDVFLYDGSSDTISRISTANSGAEGNERSLQPDISGDGRYITFVSLADNLVEGDGNGVSDIFLYDRQTETLERITINSDGVEADDTSREPALSNEGRYLVFQSKATNLVDGDNNEAYDIFLYDRESGNIELISRTAQGKPGNGESQQPSVTDEGRFVVFESWADDLVPDDTNNFSDVFVYDRQTAQMERVSLNSAGEEANNLSGGATISGDGRHVAFSSLADNLAGQDNNQEYDVYVFDRQTRSVRLVSAADSTAGNGSSISPALAAAGSLIAFDSTATNLVANDTNERVDVFFSSLPGAGPETESTATTEPAPTTTPGSGKGTAQSVYLPVITRP